MRKERTAVFVEVCALPFLENYSLKIEKNCKNVLKKEKIRLLLFMCANIKNVGVSARNSAQITSLLFKADTGAKTQRNKTHYSC